MIVRNRNRCVPKLAIDTSKTETSFLLLGSNLRKTNVTDYQQKFFDNGCLPEVLRRIYRPSASPSVLFAK